MFPRQWSSTTWTIGDGTAPTRIPEIWLLHAVLGDCTITYGESPWFYTKQLSGDSCDCSVTDGESCYEYQAWDGLFGMECAFSPNAGGCNDPNTTAVADDWGQHAPPSALPNVIATGIVTLVTLVAFCYGIRVLLGRPRGQGCCERATAVFSLIAGGLEFGMAIYWFADQKQFDAYDDGQACDTGCALAIVGGLLLFFTSLAILALGCACQSDAPPADGALEMSGVVVTTAEAPADTMLVKHDPAGGQAEA